MELTLAKKAAMGVMSVGGVRVGYEGDKSLGFRV